MSGSKPNTSKAQHGNCSRDMSQSDGCTWQGSALVWSGRKGLCLALRNGSIRDRKPRCCQLLILTNNLLHFITITVLDNTSFCALCLDSRSNIACHLAAYSCLSVDHAWLSRSGRYNTNHSDDLTRCSASPPSHVAFCIPIQISMADWRAWRSFPKAPSGFRMI
jgi:hypothetical protein